MHLVEGLTVVGSPMPRPFRPVEQVDFGQGDPFRPGPAVLVEQRAEAPVDAMHVRMAFVVEMQLGVVLADVLVVAGTYRRVGRVVAQHRILHNEVGHVDAEAVHAAPQPAARDVQHRRLHRRCAPVEVGLLRQERVQVVLPGRRVEGPGGTAEEADPVIRRPAAGRGVGPHVPVPVRVVTAGPRGPKPGMLVRGVVGDEVDEHPKPTGMGGGHQAVEGSEIAEHWVHVGVVGHVVAEVPHR